MHMMLLDVWMMLMMMFLKFLNHVHDLWVVTHPYLHADGEGVGTVRLGH